MSQVIWWCTGEKQLLILSKIQSMIGYARLGPRLKNYTQKTKLNRSLQLKVKKQILDGSLVIVYWTVHQEGTSFVNE